MLTILRAKYCLGQCVLDRQFQFRGVVIDVDSHYIGDTAWYEKNAPHHPPRNAPWYHLLVHNTEYRIYTAEMTLEPDLSGESIHHPDLDYFFKEFKNGIYQLCRPYHC